MLKSFFYEKAEFSDLLRKIILSRILFALILIIACIVFSSGEDLSFFSQPFLSLYNISGIILFLSIVYLIWLYRFSYKLALAYSQTTIDTFIVTGIIFVTGSYDSIFTFLYLLIIVYTAVMLLEKGAYIIAALASVQYAVLIELEYYNIVDPFLGKFYLSGPLDENRMIYRIIVIAVSCFAVAFLSSVLMRQVKTAKMDLKMIQDHLSRVERMSAVDELISGIAHEINNPLASLSGSIQLLHEDARPGSYEDKLMQIILKETGRLENIVNDIRVFARPNTENAKDIEIDKAIEEIAGLFINDPEYGDRINLTLNLKKGVRICIDPLHFHQIVWNLLKNAAQSIEASGEIDVKIKQIRNKGVLLIVQDNGKGIPPEKSKHIFDPFYTTKPDGTGLGLSIIHKIIDAYKGMIDFESTPGQGTVFRVLFSELPAAGDTQPS